MKDPHTLLKQGKALKKFSGALPRLRLERGSALFVGMAMLIIVTLLSLAAMQSVKLQERMAGNATEMSRLFQTAESALRDAENRLLEDRTCEGEKLNESPGFFHLLETDGTIQLDFNIRQGWVADGIRHKKACLPLGTYYGIRPWYVIEQLPNAQADASLDAAKKRDVFVYRANVLSANADPDMTSYGGKDEDPSVLVILQSIVMRQ